MAAPLFLGLDLGTSGVRAAVIDPHASVVATARAPLPSSGREGGRVTQDPADWWRAVEQVLGALPARERANVAALAVDGTSGTLLLADARGTPLTPALMYDDTSCSTEALRVAAVAPADSPACGGALPRLLRLQTEAPQAAHALHQADWVAARLCGRLGVSDENNALKTGYDAQARRWPDWLVAAGVRRALLPRVVPPGTPLGPLAPRVARALGLPAGCRVVAGTTDGVAAFLATGAQAVGEAVTSLGSTLTLKLLSPRPLAAPERGLYSHRLGGAWLAGGASNSGGAALARHFAPERLAALEAALRPAQDTGLDYWPLPAPGERFPINDPALPPREQPRPADDAVFLQGLLEGIARIERLGYECIAAAGGPWPTRVWSVGGGARNAAWRRIRERVLGVPVLLATHEDAAVGAARLALQAVTGPRP